MKTIAFLGDSITLGYGLNNLSDRYSSLVCRLKHCKEENYGITGTLIARAGLNACDGKAFIDRLNLVYSADVAVIFGGTNDYFWSNKPIFGNDESYFEYAVIVLCARIKKKQRLVADAFRHAVSSQRHRKLCRSKALD